MLKIFGGRCQHLWATASLLQGRYYDSAAYTEMSQMCLRCDKLRRKTIKGHFSIDLLNSRAGITDTVLAEHGWVRKEAACTSQATA